MITNALKQDFSGGEVSGKVSGRSDLPLYKSVMEWIQNFIALPQGPVTYRAGMTYVHHTRLHKYAVFIPFLFNDTQAYLIEATDLKFRFYKSTGIITEADKTITAITQTVPAQVTSAAHGYNNGDEVFINDVAGMTQINGRSYIVANKSTNTYELNDEFGNQINASGYSAYTSGGHSNRIYEITTPYTEADLQTLTYAQNADTMYIVSRFYAPRKLIRTGETNWTLNTFVRTSDPFTGSTEWPGAVTFTSDGAIMYGGTIGHPETIFKSRGPGSGGVSRFDDFTQPATPTATDAVTFTLAPIHGKVDSIRWLSNTDKFIVAGTYGSVRRIYGSSEDQPITPTSINARSVNAYGAAKIKPVPNGPQMLYVQRNGTIIRSVEYDYQIDGYQSLDKNLVSDHILGPGVVQICSQFGNPEILWGVRSDGLLAGLTYNDKENKYGWHRHKMADGDVEWAETMPRESNQDILWTITKRFINGRTVRHVEFMTDLPRYPEKLNFYTGVLNKADDDKRYQNALYEKQKFAVHVDSSVSYDGSALGTALSSQVTPGAGATVVGTTGVTMTASTATFTASMVGRQIWKKYDEDGIGGGRFRIDAFSSSTVVTGTILTAFDSVEVITPGNWFLTASTISGLHHLEDTEVSIVIDGAIHPSRTVTNGVITLDPGKAASVITIGLPYVGLLQSMAIDQGGQSGPAVTKIKNMKECHIKFINSAGVAFGTNPYDIEKIDFRTTAQITGRPIPLFSGVKNQTYEDHSEREKHLYIVQNVPLPCTVSYMDTYISTTDE
jgi:hypothetical protein